jgi:hypothetical protein
MATSKNKKNQLFEKLGTGWGVFLSALTIFSLGFGTGCYVKETLSKLESFEDRAAFNNELLEYLAKVTKALKDKNLKNKVKLIMKQIIYQDDESKKEIFENKEKNELLSYWKNSYMKELEEIVFKEKNKILQEKLENSDPYDQYLELVKKRRQRKKKSRTRKSVFGFNNLFGSSRSNNIYNKSFPKIKVKKYPNSVIRRKKDQKK